MTYNLIVFYLLTSFASLIFQHDSLAMYFTNIITLVSCKLYFYLGFPRKSYLCSLSISAPLITSKSFSRVQTDLTGAESWKIRFLRVLWKLVAGKMHVSTAGKGARLKMVFEQVKPGVDPAWHAHLRHGVCRVSCSAGVGRNWRHWDSSMRNPGKSLSGEHNWEW